MGALAALLASAVCLAAPLQRAPDGRDFVRVGPLVGYVVLPYDARNGLFALHAGPLRTSTLSQKIPWFTDAGARVGPDLVVSGVRLAPSRQTFRQRFTGVYPSGGTRLMFPSIISPPSAGCWRFTFTTGSVEASLRVLVVPRVA